MRFHPSRLFQSWLLLLALLLAMAPRSALGMNDRARELREKGLAAQKAGRIDEAISQFTQAKSADPNSATIYNDLGICYELKKDPAGAESMYRKSVQADPDFAQAHTNLALLYESQGKQDQALVQWEKRAELGPPDSRWAIQAAEKLMTARRGKSTPEKTLAKNASSKPKAEVQGREAAMAAALDSEVKQGVLKKSNLKTNFTARSASAPHSAEARSESVAGRSNDTRRASHNGVSAPAPRQEFATSSKKESLPKQAAVRHPIQAAPPAGAAPTVPSRPPIVSQAVEPSVPDLKKAREWVRMQLAASEKPTPSSRPKP